MPALQGRDRSAIFQVYPCKDGVFSNLNAKPEVIRIENLDTEDKPPPYYECVMNMPPTYHEAIDDGDALSSITIDGMEVGNGSLFVLHCLIGVLFHVIGVAAGLILGHTHAGRYGSLSALGILMLIRVQDRAKEIYRSNYTITSS